MTAEETIAKYGPEESWTFDPRNGQPLKRGPHNWRNLFKKPTTSDWLILIILIITLVGAYAYYHDTKTCRETIQNLPTICMQYEFSQDKIAKVNSELNSTYKKTADELKNLNISVYKKEWINLSLDTDGGNNNG